MKTVLNGPSIWRIITWLRCLALCLLISLTTAQSINAFELLVGTGMPGTFSQFTARALCRILERQNENLICQPVSSEDELDILTNVQGGSLDLALVDSQLLSESLSGKGSFRFLDISYEQLRIITPLYNIPGEISRMVLGSQPLVQTGSCCCYCRGNTTILGWNNMSAYDFRKYFAIPCW